MMEPSAALDCLARQVVDAAFNVHRTLGPGLLESVYKQCITYELEVRAVPLRRQVVLPITYRGHPIEAAYRIDMLVNDAVVVEIKAVEKLLPVHEVQLCTYPNYQGAALAC